MGAVLKSFTLRYNIGWFSHSNSQNPREASSRSRIFLFSLVNMWFCWCVFLSVQRLLATTKKDTDPKFGTHTPQYHIWVFCFFEKVTLRAASLEKLPCHMHFPHIFSIALFFIILDFKKPNFYQKSCQN